MTFDPVIVTCQSDRRNMIDAKNAPRLLFQSLVGIKQSLLNKCRKEGEKYDTLLPSASCCFYSVQEEKNNNVL